MRRIRFPDGRVKPDLLLDDSALVFRSGAGLVIITGCSHAGICTITEYAREVCGEQRVTAIIGGLHLLTPSPSRLTKTGEYLQSLSCSPFTPVTAPHSHLKSLLQGIVRCRKWVSV